jgi:hypothetical protein
MLLVATTLLGGCTSGSGPVASASSTPAKPDPAWTGRPVEARKQLIKVLKQEPGDAIARKLIDQIDKDPRMLLGSKNFPYVLKEADSFSQLAQTYLGDPMLFYALARYNGIVASGDIPVGRSILIPGSPPVVRKPPPPATVSKPEPKSVDVERVTPPATRPTRVTNPARGAQLRGQALAALNGGAIHRAVALLRQALIADPNSAVIKSDLDRATRIQASVRRP